MDIAISVLKRLGTKRYKKISLENISKEGGGVIGDLKISSDGKRIGAIMTTPKSPSNIYIIDFESKKAYRLTQSLLGNIPEEIMIQPELIKYKSFDGLEIQAFIYKPRHLVIEVVVVEVIVLLNLEPYYQYMAVLQLKKDQLMHMPDYTNILQITG